MRALVRLALVPLVVGLLSAPVANGRGAAVTLPPSVQLSGYSSVDSSPVFDAEGGVLLMLARTHRRASVLRWVPGQAGLREVRREALPRGGSVYRRFGLEAVGARFALARDTIDCSGPGSCRYGELRVRHAAVDVFDLRGRGRQTIARCGPDCGTCFYDTPGESLFLLAGDLRHLFVAASCGAGSQDAFPRPAVLDVRSGVRTPVDIDPGYGPWEMAGGYLHHLHPALAVNEVFDWRIGRRVYPVEPRTLFAALRDDGSLIYTSAGPPGWPVSIITPEHPEPVRLPIQGQVLGAAGDRVLVGEDLPSTDGRRRAVRLRVVRTDGSVVGEGTLRGTSVPLDHRLPFDGRRVLVTTKACAATQLVLWDVGAPTRAAADCAPLELGRLRVGWPPGGPRGDLRGIFLDVSCPRSAGQGCGGRLELPRNPAPFAEPIGLSLRPGQRRRVDLGSYVSRQDCRRLAHRRPMLVVVHTGADLATRHDAVATTRQRVHVIDGCSRDPHG